MKKIQKTLALFALALVIGLGGASSALAQSTTTPTTTAPVPTAPNTGAGGSALITFLTLAASGAVALGGVTYLMRRNHTQKEVEQLVP